MSMDPILWAMKDAPIADAEEWAILVCLAERADDDGCSSFPSQQTIAKRVKLADRTVRRRLEAMESRGLIGRGDQAPAAYLKDKAPVVWDLLIPLSWFPNLDRIQDFRERKNREPLTALDRPDIAVAPDKLRRVDFGTARPPDYQTGRTSSPGGLSDRADSLTGATGLQVRSDRTTSPPKHKEQTLASKKEPPVATAPGGEPSGPAKPKRPRRTASELNADRPDVEHLCSLMVELVVGNGSKRPSITDTWRTDMRLLLDADKREPEKAEHLMRWAAASSFWRSNVRCPSKFREQYDTLRLQALEQWEKAQKAKAAREIHHVDRAAPENVPAPRNDPYAELLRSKGTPA